MAFTINGIGTTFYGQRDFRADGSYVTTEWFVILYLPVVPIKSLRIAETNDRTNAVIYSSESYHVLGQVPLSAIQVLSTYLFTMVYVGGIASTFYLGWPWYVIVLSFIVPWFVVFLVREIARSMSAQAEANDMLQPLDQPVRRANRCSNCDNPLTRAEVTAGKCPACGEELAI